MNKVLSLFEDVGVGGLWCLTAIQTEQALRIANLILAILTTLFIFVTRFIEWFKKAKADGKITKDELKEGVTIITEGVEDIKTQIDSHTKKGD